MFSQMCIATRSVVKATMVMGLVAALGALPVEAKTLYVNGSTGNDSTSYAANGPSAPWRSIGRALWGSTNRGAPNGAEAARAGDVVDVACGMYDTPGPNANGFTGIALSPVNNGTAGQPIRIQSSTNQPCIQVRFTSGSGSVIGTHDKSYVQWSGFDLNETNTPWDVSHGHQSAQVWISGDEAGTTAVGNVVENSRFQGTSTSARDGDNYTTIRLHGTSGTTIRNVYVRNVGQTDENSGCILWYFTKNITIEHNRFERCGSGIYMKGDSLPTHPGFYTIRFNRFVDNHIGIIAFTNANAAPATPGLIHQNIFERGQYGVKLNAFGDDRNPNDLKFLNNIFSGQSSWCLEVRGDLIGNAGMVFQNNICVGSGDAAIGSDGGTTAASLQAARFLANHNVYQNVSQTRFSTVSLTEVSFSSWQSTYGQDAAAPAGLITSSPLFADTDFHAAATSPALNRGRAAYGVGGANGTPIHAGPYITGAEVIGPTSLGPITPPLPAPAAPTNVRVIR